MTQHELACKVAEWLWQQGYTVTPDSASGWHIGGWGTHDDAEIELFAKHRGWQPPVLEWTSGVPEQGDGAYRVRGLTVRRAIPAPLVATFEDGQWWVPGSSFLIPADRLEHYPERLTPPEVK